MKKQYIVIIVVGAVCAILLILALLKLNNGEKYHLFLRGDDVYFEMSQRALVHEKGKPDRIVKNVSDTPMDEYVYIEYIGERQAQCSYFMLRSKLTEVDIVIEDIDYDSALSLIQEIRNNQKAYYSEYSGFYQSEIEKGEGTTFKVSDGVNFGATGISFFFEFSSDQLKIMAIYQK